MSDAYAKVDCSFVCVTGKAVLIDIGGDEHWVPRSCVHGADETRLDTLSYGDEVELRIFQWLCELDGLL